MMVPNVAARSLRLAQWPFWLLILAAAPAHAAPDADRLEVGLAMEALQLDDTRLQTVGWRLATANAAFCAAARPAVGLLLQDVMNYNDPGSIRTALGISSDIAVQAVAPDSPAARAGLSPNDAVLAIGSWSMADLPSVPAGDYTRLKTLHDRIDGLLADGGKIRLRVKRGSDEEREVELAGVPACPGRFELRTQGGKAQADGSRVLIGRRFGAAKRPSDVLEESEFAAVVAHEFAHNLLGHGDWLEREGRGWGNIRRTEREADRLSVWLLANAGYDPAGAVRLMRGWGRRNDLGILRLPTHEGWDERAASMESEIAPMRAAMERRGAADWSRDFLRE
ncbi:MAG: hypothetical protein WCY92_12510 [Novosphingobium sp.]